MLVFYLLIINSFVKYISRCFCIPRLLFCLLQLYYKSNTCTAIYIFVIHVNNYHFDVLVDADDEIKKLHEVVPLTMRCQYIPRGDICLSVLLTSRRT